MPEITHSVLDWLNAIPEDMAREAALRNFKDQQINPAPALEEFGLTEEQFEKKKAENSFSFFPDFSSALNGAFVWSETPEKYEYWAYIHKKLKYQIKL